MLDLFCHPILLSLWSFSLPSGDWHPVVVHLPLTFLATAWLFWLLVLFPGKNHHLRRFYACLVLLLGYVSLLAAVTTGEQAAEKLTQPDRAVVTTLEQHDTAALQTRLYYTITLCGAALAFFFGLLSRKKKRPQSVLFLDVTVFVLTLGGLYFLYKTGHSGGRLVHEHGVHSDVFRSNQTTQPSLPAADAPIASSSSESQKPLQDK